MCKMYHQWIVWIFDKLLIVIIHLHLSRALKLLAGQHTCVICVKTIRQASGSSFFLEWVLVWRVSVFPHCAQDTALPLPAAGPVSHCGSRPEPYPRSWKGWSGNKCEEVAGHQAWCVLLKNERLPENRHQRDVKRWNRKFNISLHKSITWNIKSYVQRIFYMASAGPPPNIAMFSPYRCMTDCHYNVM